LEAKPAAQIQEQLCILVVSCDKYADLWGPFFTLFWRFWPDCPFRVCLLTNEFVPDLPRVTNINMGPDVSWSDNLRRGLERITEPYLLMLVEDLFLRDVVKTERVLRLLRWIRECEPNYVRLNPYPKTNRPYNDIVGVVPPGTLYRASTVASVWKRQVLSELLREGESAWDFEVYGSIRSDSYPKFFSMWDCHLPVLNGVVKGKWLPGAVAALEAAGVRLDLGCRKVMSRREAAAFAIKEWGSGWYRVLVPARYRRRIKHALLRGRYQYNQEGRGG